MNLAIGPAASCQQAINHRLHSPLPHLATQSCSFNSVSLSISSHISSSVMQGFFLWSLSFFSISLIFFFASFSLKAFFTSTLFPAPSYTTSSPPSCCLSSSSSHLDSPSIRRRPPIIIHFSVATLSQNSLL